METTSSRVRPIQTVLAAIADWDHNDPKGLFGFVARNWDRSGSGVTSVYSDCEDHYVFRTYGIQDNRDMISALMGNERIWSECWESSERGGVYTFVIPEAYHERRVGEILAEVKSVLEYLDELATVWGDEGVFRRCRDRLRNLVK